MLAPTYAPLEIPRPRASPPAPDHTAAWGILALFAGFAAAVIALALLKSRDQ